MIYIDADGPLMVPCDDTPSLLIIDALFYALEIIDEYNYYNLQLDI